VFDLDTLACATDNFSVDNKIREGGFGSVYKVLICKQYLDGFQIHDINSYHHMTEKSIPFGKSSNKCGLLVIWNIPSWFPTFTRQYDLLIIASDFSQGTLPDGREIVVKRLSKNSRQGIGEYMTEVEYIFEISAPESSAASRMLLWGRWKDVNLWVTAKQKFGLLHFQ